MELDYRCSASCTRSGLTALILSVLAFVMLEPLTKARQFEALLQYLSGRVGMKESLDRLEGDAAWKVLSAGEMADKAANQWKLAQLLNYKTTADVGVYPPISSVEGNAESPSKPKADPRAPAAPTSIRISTEVLIGPIHTIAELLEKLGDGNMLVQARRHSFKYNRSIFRWSVLLYRLIFGREFSPLTQHRQERTGNVPTYSKNQLSLYLTLPKIKRLINYEMPDSRDIESLLRESNKVTLPWIGMPLRLGSGVLFVEIGLLISTFYFWLYYREAQLSNNFPSDGTLFGVFFRTRFSSMMFEIFITIPAIAASLLAFRSFWITPINAFLAVLVLLAVCLIQFRPRVANSG